VFDHFVDVNKMMGVGEAAIMTFLGAGLESEAEEEQ
jgi:hypothetical protein